MCLMKKADFTPPYAAPKVKVCVLHGINTICVASPNQGVTKGDREYNDDDFEE